MSETKNLPTIKDLHSDNLEAAYKNDQLNFLLNQEPKPSWIKTHPFIKDHRYIPIDKVEFMLRRIFGKYRIEITGQGTAFNGVYVTVRVHYLNPVTSEMDWHDGIGACQLQTAKGTSPADLGNINNGALSMAFPIAKTLAVKDACDHFGKLFGSDLNRKDTIPFTPEKSLTPKDKEDERLAKLINQAKTKQDLIAISDKVDMVAQSEQINTLFNERMEELRNAKA